MNRIYHPWNKWECFKAGFYNNKPQNDTIDDDQCKQEYADFLKNTEHFEFTLGRVIIEWPNSCEHNLSNESMNRIAWLGQACLCYEKQIPSVYRGGFNLLTKEQQLAANMSALKYLNKWLESRNEKTATLKEAESRKDEELN